MTPRLFLSLLLLLAACQPIPRPFADSVTAPGIPALRPPDSAGVTVMPVTGAPQASGTALAEALAKALRDADVPASTEGFNRGSYRLSAAAGTSLLGAGRLAIKMAWELRDADGDLVGEGLSQGEAPAAQWQAGNPALADSLARQAAPAIADLVSGEAPLPSNVAAAVRVDHVTGAPGDGRTALARAIGTALGRAGVDVAKGTGKARFLLDCQVELSKRAGATQHVRVRWVLSGANGKPVGQVAQENDVPAGALDGAWGDIAYAVASAAAPGIANLIERASSAPTGS